MDRGAQIWAAALVLTFAAIVAVVVLWVLAISAWRETLGAGAYLIVLAAALVMGIGVGLVIRWLSKG